MSEFLDTGGFPLVGASCSFKLCGERDFLPFPCQHCSGLHCLAHAARESHECSNYDAAAVSKLDGIRALVCPLCRKAVRDESAPGDGDGAEVTAWHAHEAVCSGRAQELPSCPAIGCSKALTPSGSVICPSCRKRVCLKHRYADMHLCRATHLDRLDGKLRAQQPPQALPAASDTTLGASTVPSGALGTRPTSGCEPDRRGFLDRLEASTLPATVAPVATKTDAAFPPRVASAVAVAAGYADAAFDGAVATGEMQGACGAEAGVEESLAQLHAASDEAEGACARTLLKMLENIIRQPAEGKYRALNRANKALATRVFAVRGAEALLLAVGWVADQEADGLVFPAAAPLPPLELAARRLRARIGELDLELEQAASLAASLAASPAASPVASPAASGALAGWACRVCTLANEATSATCAACGACGATP